VTELRLERGDITRQAVDAVVNAANSGLLGGGGVDGAIHRAGGPEILEACRRIRVTTHPDGLPPGEAVATTAGRMKARHVIHTVGPVWQGGGRGEDTVLAACYRNALALAASMGLGSVAFPAIATGVYGFPKDRAAAVVARVLKEHFARPGAPEARGPDVRLVFFAQGDADRFVAIADGILGR
jgi:O-acetyl-ADP-ribose deacetylase (regulator of RNase III)